VCSLSNKVLQKRFLIDDFKDGHSLSKNESEKKKKEGQIASAVEYHKEDGKVINPLQCGLCNKQFAELNIHECYG
jgi:hypothetical protein